MERGEIGRRFRAYRASAKRRDLSFELDIQGFWTLIDSPCHYCGISPAGGIDRIDNWSGYTDRDPENVVPCCTICNRAKRDLEYEEFMAWIRRVSAHHR